MNLEHLITMANDIAAFFDSEADKQAAAGQVAMHLRRYWEPRMREAIRRHFEAGGAGLSDLARAGVAEL